MSDEPSSTSEQVETLMARVFALIRACPIGRVTTYGALAKTVGYPRGACMVGWFMNESPEGVPAQRVINNKGELEDHRSALQMLLDFLLLINTRGNQATMPAGDETLPFEEFQLFFQLAPQRFILLSTGVEQFKS